MANNPKMQFYTYLIYVINKHYKRDIVKLFSVLRKNFLNKNLPSDLHKRTLLIGEVLKSLVKNGFGENTIVTFIGDHGPTQIKEILQGTLKQCTNVHDWMVSSDKTYKAIWNENYVFASLLNPSQMALCNQFKEQFLKFLFGDLEYTFQMNMLSASVRISYNSTTMNGGFTFSDEIDLKVEEQW